MSVTQDSYIKLRHTIESVPQKKKKHNSLEIRPGEEFMHGPAFGTVFRQMKMLYI